MHELLHVLGIDTQQSYFYDFWSGIGTQIALVLTGFGIYRKQRCHVHRCWRIGKFAMEQFRVCQRHHPDVPEQVTAEHLLR